MSQPATIAEMFPPPGSVFAEAIINHPTPDIYELVGPLTEMVVTSKPAARRHMVEWMVRTLLPVVSAKLNQQTAHDGDDPPVNDSRVSQSSKWGSQMTEPWRRRSIPLGDGVRKFFEDLTVEDLEWKADQHHKLERAHKQSRGMFLRLRDLVTESGVSRLGDLPDEVVLEVLP